MQHVVRLRALKFYIIIIIIIIINISLHKVTLLTFFVAHCHLLQCDHDVRQSLNHKAYLLHPIHICLY
jgi:hypothetical protein